MIYSMTAFARAQHQGDFGSLICEIRSINHRYLDIGLHLPEVLRFLEMPIRDRIRHFVKRGKVECTLRYQASAKEAGSLFTLNLPLVKALCAANEKITGLLSGATASNPGDILRFPGVLEAHDPDLGLLQKEVLGLLDKTLTELVAARGREGQELKQVFLGKMALLQGELAKVRVRLPQVLSDANERLTKRFSDIKMDLDPGRLAQEMVVYAQKIDITEEVDRTETHITEIRRVLDQDELVGRRLDFLLQELNREANTLGSKSVDPTVTHAAVEMKVLIEQVREQVQNVE